MDPSRELWRIGRRRIAAARVPIEFLPVSAEGIPLPDAAVDTVVSTWTLCSVGDPSRALDEVRRVLKPGGRFLFIEHGAAPDPRVRAWQDRLTPWWRRVAGNCHLTHFRQFAFGTPGIPDSYGTAGGLYHYAGTSTSGSVGEGGGAGPSGVTRAGGRTPAAAKAW